MSYSRHLNFLKRNSIVPIYFLKLRNVAYLLYFPDYKINDTSHYRIFGKSRKAQR